MQITLQFQQVHIHSYEQNKRPPLNARNEIRLKMSIYSHSLISSSSWCLCSNYRGMCIVHNRSMTMNNPIYLESLANNCGKLKPMKRAKKKNATTTTTTTKGIRIVIVAVVGCLYPSLNMCNKLSQFDARLTFFGFYCIIMVSIFVSLCLHVCYVSIHYICIRMASMFWCSVENETIFVRRDNLILLPPVSWKCI